MKKIAAEKISTFSIIFANKNISIFYNTRGLAADKKSFWCSAKKIVEEDIFTDSALMYCRTWKNPSYILIGQVMILSNTKKSDLDENRRTDLHTTQPSGLKLEPFSSRQGNQIREIKRYF